METMSGKLESFPLFAKKYLRITEERFGAKNVRLQDCMKRCAERSRKNGNLFLRNLNG